jgi:hypothetical protein
VHLVRRVRNRKWFILVCGQHMAITNRTQCQTSINNNTWVKVIRNGSMVGHINTNNIFLHTKSLRNIKSNINTLFRISISLGNNNRIYSRMGRRIRLIWLTNIPPLHHMSLPRL